MELTRSRFEDCSGSFGRKYHPTNIQALKDCDLKPADIDRIVLVGDRLRFLWFKSATEVLWRQDGGSLCKSDEAVALGAQSRRVLGGG